MNQLLENSELEFYAADAKGIAWDTCHKIYLLMDDQQVALMREYGYGDENDPDSLITSDQMTPEEMVAKVSEWFEDSCSLKFIQAVRTVEGDPNEGFEDIVGQFDTLDEDEDEDEDY